MSRIRNYRVGWRWVVYLCTALFQIHGIGAAQYLLQPTPQVPTTTTALLQQMATQSGRILLGHVVNIHLAGAEVGTSLPEWPDGSRVVEISLQVEDCVLGCSANQVVVLREWASLWRGQPHRYVLGQRAVWMIYPANAAGISSPVNGMMGVLPVRTSSETTNVASTSSENNLPQSMDLIDLRWLRTAVLRSNARNFSTAGAGVRPLTTDPNQLSVSEQKMEQPTAPLTTVMGVLHAFAPIQ